MASSPDVATRHKARVEDNHESPSANSTNYPTGLNPFGDDTASDEYPDQLNPFSDDTEDGDQSELDEYDHSLNPFAGDDQQESGDKDEEPLDATNPFADSDDGDDNDHHQDDDSSSNNNKTNDGLEDASQNGDTSKDVEHPSELQDVRRSPPLSSAPSPRPRSTLNSLQISTPSLHSHENSTLSSSPTPSSTAVNQSETNDASLTTSQSSVSEFRPVPLPRKKSSLKKTGTLLNPNGSRAAHSTSSLPRISTTADGTGTGSDTNRGPDISNKDQQFLERRSFQNRKRAAPPLPVNFKRQVDGCLSEIESEIENIGVKLLKIEQESLECRLRMQEKDKKKKKRFTLKKDSSEDEAAETLSALFRQKSQLARRQKELMYKKREHILDLHYSDIEYQLRMITNKQAHLRTEEDDAREQELLKKLVEIVEEKNDIVENQIKDSSMV